MSEAIKTITPLKSKKTSYKKKYSQEEIDRVAELLHSAQFDIGRKTDSVKIIRKERL